MKTPLTGKVLRNHLTYSWWKYVALIAAAVIGWNILYTMTAYRAPNEKRVVMGVYAYGDEENINAYMEGMRLELLAEMEEMRAIYMIPDQIYGDAQLNALIISTSNSRSTSNLDWDLFVLPEKQFRSLTELGAFMPLEDALPGLVAELEAAGIQLDSGWLAAGAGSETHLYGIPCAQLPGIRQMLQCSTGDMYISVFYKTGNDENVLLFFERFLRDMMAQPVADAE